MMQGNRESGSRSAADVLWQNRVRAKSGRKRTVTAGRG